jgi:hypothetical protein
VIAGPAFATRSTAWPLSVKVETESSPPASLYQGRIEALNGTRIAAVVSDSGRSRVRLDINLRIDTAVGRATGAVRAT